MAFQNIRGPENNLIAFLQEKQLVTHDTKLLLAVSGGLDSVCMLHLFCKIRPFFNIELSVLHLNHGLRGAESDGDAAFVKKLAGQYQLPFFNKKVDTLAYKEKNKLSLEEAARELRYKFFEETLNNAKADLLATAHTADDQAETIIDHFLRGSGLLGMSGMPVKRNYYIRPMLCFSRAELENYANREKLVFREDASNRDLSYKRNRIRHELLPYLKENFNPNLTATLNRTATIFRDTEDYLEQVAKDACKSLVSLQKKNEISLEIEGYLSYNIQIRNYILFACLDRLRINRKTLNFDKLYRINQLIEKREICKRFPIDDTFELWIDRDVFIISKHEIKQKEKISFNLESEKSARYRDCQFIWSFVEKDTDIVFDTNKNVEYFDCDKIGINLTLRPPYPGDYFIPLNFTGRKKLSDFFTDNKVPINERRNIAVLESDNKIVWVCGYQIDNRFKVRPETKKVLKMEMKG